MGLYPHTHTNLTTPHCRSGKAYALLVFIEVFDPPQDPRATTRSQTCNKKFQSEDHGFKIKRYLERRGVIPTAGDRAWARAGHYSVLPTYRRQTMTSR